MSGFLLATSLFASSALFGPHSFDFSLPSWLDANAAETNSPGLSIALWDGQGEIQTATWGLADLELEVPVEPNHIFRVGSVTKPFTSMLVLQLIEEGRLELETPLAEVIADVPDEWHAVTIRQLLNHTSGIPNYTAQLRVLLRDVRLPTQGAEILDSLPSKALLFEPGSRFDYSNTNYVLLTWVVEAVDERRFGESLRARILEPLGLERTHYPTDTELIVGRVRGYRPLSASEWRLPWPISVTWPLGAGAIESSAADLVRFGRAVVDSELLDADTTEIMMSPTAVDEGDTSFYALGWIVSETPFGTVWEHAGGIFGFTAHLLICPERLWVIAGLANSEASRITPLVRDLFRDLAQEAGARETMRETQFAR